MGKSTEKCMVNGCSRFLHAKGLCKSHYGLYKKTGDIPKNPIGYRKEIRDKGCQVDGCDSPYFSLGYCIKHYARYKKYGDPLFTKKYYRPKKAFHVCSVEGCDSEGRTNNLCNAHYQRYLKYGDPLVGGTIRRRKESSECSIDGCFGNVIAKGLCSKHYSKLRKYGEPLHESDWYKKRYKNFVNDQGYIEVYVGSENKMAKNSRVTEHRLVMSEFLGRPLLDNENVHHKNGDKTDNRIENLELWVVTQPSGQRPLDLIEYAREILRVYEHEEDKYISMYRTEKELYNNI